MSYISISMLLLLLLYSEGTFTLAAFFCYFCIRAYMQNCYIKKKAKKKVGSLALEHCSLASHTLRLRVSHTWLCTILQTRVHFLKGRQLCRAPPLQGPAPAPSVGRTTK